MGKNSKTADKRADKKIIKANNARLYAEQDRQVSDISKRDPEPVGDFLLRKQLAGFGTVAEHYDHDDREYYGLSKAVYGLFLDPGRITSPSQLAKGLTELAEVTKADSELPTAELDLTTAIGEMEKSLRISYRAQFRKGIDRSSGTGAVRNKSSVVAKMYGADLVEQLLEALELGNHAKAAEIQAQMAAIQSATESSTESQS
jgi:hypothetical protein